MAEPAAEASMSSPLSGGYLLIILAEPHSQEHKQILLQRLAKGRKKRFFFENRVKEMVLEFKFWQNRYF